MSHQKSLHAKLAAWTFACIINSKNLLIDILKLIVNNSFKKKFYEKKKVINVLTDFIIYHKNNVKTFLKKIVHQCPMSTHQHDP